MKGIRRQVSLLLANGHTDARNYTIGRVWIEAEIVAQRINRDHATAALLTQLAVSTILSEDAGKTFNERIKELTDGG